MAIVDIAGQFKVSNMTVLANARSPQAVFMGDSIAWGVDATSAAYRWADLIGVQLPSYIVSGRPGGVTLGVGLRITNEITYLTPKYVVISIGHNDATIGTSLGTFESELNADIVAAQATGARVIVATIPYSTFSTSTIASFNAYILTLNLPIVRFDIAINSGNYMTLLSGDGTHPNNAGYAAMAARFIIDTPSIFD